MADLLTALVDDAGLYPPTSLSMADAVDRHRRDRRSDHAMLSSMFVCGSSRVEELRSFLADDDAIAVALVIEDVASFAGAVVAVRDDPRLRLAAVEVPFRLFADGDGTTAAEGVRDCLDLVDAVGAGAEVPVFIEPLTVAGAVELVTGIAPYAPRAGLKLRCGGTAAESFPAASALAAAVVSARDAGVRFKATAGLHHAFPYVDPATGFEHFGYLNLVAASARAIRGEDRLSVEAALTLDDVRLLHAEVLAIDPQSALLARRLFASYGSCSTSVPVIEAYDLGLTGVGSHPAPASQRSLA